MSGMKITACRLTNADQNCSISGTLLDELSHGRSKSQSGNEIKRFNRPTTSNARLKSHWPETCQSMKQALFSSLLCVYVCVCGRVCGVCVHVCVCGGGGGVCAH